MDKHYKILSEEIIVSPNNSKHRLIDATVKLPNGQKRVWQYIKSRRVVTIAAVNDRKEIWCVRQWRPARNEFVWELPAGGIEIASPTEEQVFADANRELREEVGYQANTFKLLAKFSPTIHFSSTYYAVLATNLVSSALPSSADEELETKLLPFDQAYDLLINRHLPSAITLVGLMAAKQALGSNY